MPTKKTTKSDSKVVKSSEKKAVLKSENKKDSSKKVVIKRRKVDLVPTKASAVAIASQANRTKKQALIEKMESGNSIPRSAVSSGDDTKIPLWVRIFFGCSLLLFCISFYQAVFRPAINRDLISSNENADIFLISGNGSEMDEASLQGEEYVSDAGDTEVNQNYEREVLDGSSNVVINTIQEYFYRLSNRDFEEASDLLIPALRNSSEMRDHFTSFRMNPFLDGIEGGKIIPTDFNYVSTSTFGRDRYSFSLSYVLKSNQERYDEIWEMVVDTKGEEPKITNIVCVTSKCSYHPIFWPENFDLMK